MDEKNVQWGIVEAMGHNIVAGIITQEVNFGVPLLRVDVPATSDNPAGFTQLYGNSAIFRVTFTSEEVARLTAEQVKTNPVAVYVPELVTREKHEQAIAELREQLQRTRRAQIAPPDVRAADIELEQCEKCETCETCELFGSPECPAEWEADEEEEIEF